MAYQLGAGWEEVENAIHAWLSTATGLPIRWANPDAPEEDDTLGYGTLRVQAFQRRGRPALEYSNTDATPAGKVELVRHQAGVLAVTAQLYTAEKCGNGSAFPLMCQASSALDDPGVYGPMIAAGLGLVGRGDVRDLTQLIGLGRQGRAVLELRFEVREVASGLVDAIAGVRSTGSTT